MHPLVRDLLKRVIFLKKEHMDPEHLMRATRREMAKNAHLSEEKDILKAVAYGRYLLRQEQSLVRFKYYRMLQQRYNPQFQYNKAGEGFKPEKYDESHELIRIRRNED